MNLAADRVRTGSVKLYYPESSLIPTISTIPRKVHQGQDQEPGEDHQHDSDEAGDADWDGVAGHGIPMQGGLNERMAADRDCAEVFQFDHYYFWPVQQRVAIR